MTEYPCIWCRYWDASCWCALHGRIAAPFDTCPEWEREPGADDDKGEGDE